MIFFCLIYIIIIMYVSKLDAVIVNKNENIIYDSEGETRPVRPVLRKKKKKK